jgi:sigma-E factor negative regulatory protein RseC
MTEKGKVISIQNGVALVELQPGEKCGQCCACSLGGAGGKSSLEIKAPDGLRPGHEVTLEIDPAEIVKSSWTLFIFPLIALIVGAAAGPDVMRILGMRIPSDLASILLGVLFLGLAFLAAFHRSRSLDCRQKLEPKIVDFR